MFKRLTADIQLTAQLITMLEAHADECAACGQSPYPLCETGEKLLARANEHDKRMKGEHPLLYLLAIIRAWSVRTRDPNRAS